MFKSAALILQLITFNWDSVVHTTRKIVLSVGLAVDPEYYLHSTHKCGYIIFIISSIKVWVILITKL